MRALDGVGNMGLFARHAAAECRFDSSDAWVVLSPLERAIRRKVEAAGTPLRDWDVNIYRGVLTGYNDAFIVSTERREEILAACRTEAERERTAALIRPILRGRDIRRYGYQWAGLWIIATFPSLHYDIEDYPAVKDYLLSFGIERLEQTGKEHIVNGERVKARKKTGNKWFETQDSISYWGDFARPKIVWGNLNLRAGFALVENDTFVNAPSPMIVPASIFLLAVLNSKLADFYIRQLGVTRNGGYFEYKPMFVSQLPIPKDVDKRIIKRIEDGVAQNDEDLIDSLVYELYGLTDNEISCIENSMVAAGNHDKHN